MSAREPIRQELADPVDEAAVARVWAQVDSRLQEASRPRRYRAVAAASIAVAAAVALVIVLSWPDPPSDLALTEGPVPAVFVAAADSAPAEYVFDDGSRLSVHPGARVDTVDNGATVFVTRVTAGEADFEVRPGGPRQWRVEAGPLSVRVVGTRFTVARTEHGARVHVREGRVEVHDSLSGSVSTLGPGQTQVASRPPEPPPPSAEAALDPGLEAVPDDEELEEALRPAPTPPPMRRPDDWRALADAGQYDRAFDAVERQGGFDAARAAADPAELVRLADVARLSGHPRPAADALEQLLTRHGDDARAPLAAFTLGLLRLEQLGDPTGAAASFEDALSRDLSPALAESAQARIVQCWARAGRTDLARLAAERYRRAHPGGVHTDQVDRWAGPD